VVGNLVGTFEGDLVLMVGNLVLVVGPDDEGNLEGTRLRNLVVRLAVGEFVDVQ
jgi:hypothetical protein